METVFHVLLCSALPFRCPNLAVKEAEDDENVEEEDVPTEKPKKVSQAKRKKQTQCNINWVGEAVQVYLTNCTPVFPVSPSSDVCVCVCKQRISFQTEGKRQYYKKVSLNDEVLEVGDCVSVSSEDPSIPLYLAR